MSSSSEYSSDGEAASVPEEDATAKLCALEKKLNAKLALLDKIQSHDIYTCCWNGHTDLVQCHISFSSQLATVRERNNLRRARRAMALESAEEKLAELQAEVSAAEKAAQFASEKAARDAANAVDETEFGEGYRPLHYAAYAGHSETVRALLRCGADARAKNSAGCTALFLASQQGKHDVLLDHSHDWCDKSNLVSSGDGRMLCPLDVARASDKTLARAKTRSVLLDALKTRSRTLGRPQKPPKPPEVDTDDSALKGGIEVRWRPDHYDLSTADPPTQSLKIKLLTADDYRRDGATSASAAALLVAPVSAHRVRVPAARDGVATIGNLLPGCNYVAMIACVNSVGAGEYSDVSEEAIATKAHGASSTKEGKHASPSSERMLDKKVVRARIAVREAREKRQRIADMMKAQAIAEREAAAAKRKMRQGDGGELER